jgi:hypothetical protein
MSRVASAGEADARSDDEAIQRRVSLRRSDKADARRRRNPKGRAAVRQPCAAMMPYWNRWDEKANPPRAQCLQWGLQKFNGL